MSREFTATTEYTDLASWVRVTEQGYYLLDPANRQQLDPDVPHQWIQADPRLNSGLEFLRAHGPSLRLNLDFCRHNQAEDLGDGPAFEQRVAASDAYGFEGLGWNRHTFYRSLGAYALDKGTPPLYDKPFAQRVWRAAAMAPRTHSFGYDVEAATNVPLDAMLDAWCEVNGPWNTDALPTSERGPWMLATTAIREWYMVSKTGYELSQRPGRSSRNDRLNMLMTCGAEHRDLVRKFRLFGVEVSDMIIKPEIVRAAGMVETALRHGRLTMDLLTQ